MTKGIKGDLSKKSERKVPVLLIFLGTIVFLAMIWSTSKMLYLENYGKKAPGIVQSVYKVGSKGRMKCDYTFYVDGETLRGGVMFNSLKRGDSITVLYSSSYPEINVPENFFE